MKQSHDATTTFRWPLWHGAESNSAGRRYVENAEGSFTSRLSTLVFEPFSFLFAFFIIFFAFFIIFFAFFISFFAFFDLSFLATASSRAALQAPAIYHASRSSSGSFAMLAAIRLASSRVSRLADDRRPGSSSK
jgi:hypothetical protein